MVSSDRPVARRRLVEARGQLGGRVRRRDSALAVTGLREVLRGDGDEGAANHRVAIGLDSVENVRRRDCTSWACDVGHRAIAPVSGRSSTFMVEVRLDRAIRLNRVDGDGIGKTNAHQLAQSLARQLRIEAERHVRREGEAGLLVAKPAPI